MNKLSKLAAKQAEQQKQSMQYPEGSFLAGGNPANALTQAANPMQQPATSQSMPMQPAQQPAQPQAQQVQTASMGNAFNGPINAGGTTIQIKDGVALVEDGDMAGKKLFVSADGQVVWDDQGRVIGNIDSQHNLIPATQQLMQKLASMGIIKRSGGVE